eukprot:2526244-Alexandrium_andersonii.AAC.1
MGGATKKTRIAHHRSCNAVTVLAPERTVWPGTKGPCSKTRGNPTLQHNAKSHETIAWPDPLAPDRARH